jgi:hypothetical protein
MIDANAPPVERSAPDETEAPAPRMTLIDLFVLTACAGVGLGLGRLLIGADALRHQAVEASTVLVGVVCPGLFGALILGHPVVLLLHAVKGRRRHVPMRFGEIIGLVPGISLGLFVVFLLACLVISGLVEDDAILAKFAFAAGMLCLLANAVNVVVGVIYLGVLFEDRRRPRWTDALGTSAALLPGAMALTVFMLAMIYA